MATIRDVAKLAGVSRGTVDRVLHDRPNVDPIVLQKVKKAMDMLGYEAKTKLLSPKKTAAILIPQWSDSHFNRQIIMGIRRAMRHIDDPLFHLIEQPLRTTTTQELLLEIERQIANGVDGLIIRPENTEDVQSAIRHAISRGISIITYDADVTGTARLCHMGQNLMKAGAVGAGLLSKLLQPSDHVLIVTGNMRLEAHKGRVDGFCNCLLELGFAEDAYRIIETNEMHELTRDLVAAALKQDAKLKAVYMATQPVAGCVDGIRKARLTRRRPHVICNDLTPTAKKYLQDGKIDFVVGQAFFQKSYRAVVVMHRMLMKGLPPQKEMYFTDTTLISREML